MIFVDLQAVKRIKFIVLFFFFFTAGLQAAEERFTLITPLSNLWLDYNAKQVAFYPSESFLFREKHVLHIAVDFNQAGSLLVFDAKKHTHVFVDNQFFSSYDEDGRYCIPLEELSKFSNKNKAMLSFYNENGIAEEAIFLGEKHLDSQIGKEPFLPILRNKTNTTPLILLLLLVVVILAVVKRSKPITYKSYFDVTMHFKNVEEYVIFNSFSKTALLLPVIVSVLWAVSLNLCGFSFVAEKEDFTIVYLLFDALVVLLFIVVKFFYLRFLSWMLGVKDLKKTHFFEYIRIVAQCGILLFAVSVIFYISGQPSANTVPWITAISLFFLFFKIFGNLNSVHKFNYLFLFFYFCISEVLPLTILAKQLIANSI